MWQTIEYWNPKGRNYVGKIVKKLPVETQRKINRCLRILQSFGGDQFIKARQVLRVKHLKGYPLYELIIDQFRIFFVIQGNTYWLLHIFQKKRDDTPKWEIETALGRLRELEENLGGIKL